MFEHALVPGLQIEQYARGILVTLPNTTEVDVEELVTARMERQAILDRDDPPLLWVVIDEAVLHRQATSDKVMWDQLGAMLLARVSPSADPEHSKDHDSPVGLQDKVDREPVGAATERVGAHVRVWALQVVRVARPRSHFQQSHQFGIRGQGLGRERVDLVERVDLRLNRIHPTDPAASRL